MAELSLAVVVQKMVPAKVSGVLFTANPNSGARDELLVEASFSLGEALISGQVTPDTFLLSRQTLEVKETRLGSKELMRVASEQGTAPTGVRKECPPMNRSSSAGNTWPRARLTTSSYCAAHVAMACTFSTFRRKSAMRDVGKVLGLSPRSIAGIQRAVEE
ncbi:MAG TPA: PEP/pyruvate-binding domain-containing protein, partial [Candidatus Sulfomarinibacteraceae bacterium]|nr:PEP/pyruvate-binding domain-containing protein [Candidatus Sulfomarinibacteraceae bacterium]